MKRGLAAENNKQARPGVRACVARCGVVGILCFLGMGAATVAARPSTALASTYVTQVSQTPTTPTSAQSVNVVARSDTFYGEGVALQYHTGDLPDSNGGNYHSVACSYQSSDPNGGSDYSCTIPALSTGTRVQYQLYNDAYGQTDPGGASHYTGFNYSYTVSASSTGAPGVVSHVDMGRKDCLGTARNTTSKVWFTVANGVLSAVLYPTTDNANVQTLQYIVTDGSSFTDLQTRDMTYTVQPLDARALDCRVVSYAKSGKYRITTDYFTDPGANTLVMTTTFTPLTGSLSDYRLYARYNPSINGNGGGGSTNGGADSAAIDTSTGHNVLIADDTTPYTAGGSRDYATPVYSALDASRPFLQTSNGFAGTASDGLTQLDTGHALNTPQDTATNGNVAQTARVDLSGGGAFSLALGFGADQTAAVGAAEATLSAGAESVRAAYESGWHGYDSGLIAPPASYNEVSATQWGQLVDEYYLNANVLKASEDKTYPGALVASLAVPWGQSVTADTSSVDFGYREVFARDLYEQWTGLYADGDLATARDIVTFLFDRQQKPDSSFPRNSLLNGQPAPDAFNTQLDECSYPTIMAFQLGMTDSALYQNHVKPAADFVVAHGPSYAYGVERWEEQSGYSPSSIAAEIAGLVTAADIADLNGDATSARTWRAVADSWQRSIKGWTVTTSGTAAGATSGRYFIRLSKDGDPNAATTYNVGNGGPTLDQRNVIDAGFLELVRLGLLPAGDTDITRSLPVVDAAIKTDTPSGPGYHRYNGDGYGDRSDNGQPWDDAGNHQGTGHVWPVLSGERGEYQLAAGDTAATLSLLDAMRRFAGGGGLIPEQDWDQSDLAASPYGTDPMVASIGFQDGQPAGSAAPLNWAAGQYVRLLRDLTANGLIEQPADVANRYVTPSLSVAAPATLPAGGSGTVTTVYTNTAGSTVQNVTVDLHAPSGWTVQAASPATFASVPTGAAERTTWNVTRPAGAAIGADDLVATAAYTVSGVPTRDQAETTVADGALAGGGTGAAGHSGAGSLGTVDLTSEGSLDWAHWGLNDPASFDHKSAGGSQISAAASINSTAVERLADNPTGFTWSDGTPDGSASGTTTGIYVVGQGNGLQFTAPADTTTRTLKVYVGLYKAQGRLQATLSDGSAPTFDDASLDDKTGASNGVYTLTYRAASAGQTLTVTWSAAVSYDTFGNVTLASATLQQASPSDSPPSPPAATPELGSGELLATGLLPLGLAFLVRRRRARRATRR